MKTLITAMFVGSLIFAGTASGQTGGTDATATEQTPKPSKKARKKMKRTSAQAKARESDPTTTAGTVTRQNARR